MEQNEDVPVKAGISETEQSHSALNSIYCELKCNPFFRIVEEQRKIGCTDCVLDFYLLSH